MQKLIPSLRVVCLGVVLGLAGCSGGNAPPEPARILLIGLDGAEWGLIKPMIEAGEMPNLAALMEGGVHGPLRSLGPPLAKSPAIWTTIATGKSPQEHGISGFVTRERGPGGGMQPLTKNARQVNALWNIMSAVGKRVGVVGWLMTWPAEEVNGFVVSDYLQYDAGRSTDKMAGRTFPNDLEARIAGDVTYWQEVPWSAAQPFLDAPVDTVNMSRDLETLLRPIRTYLAADQTFARIGLKLYTEEEPDFFAVYLRGMDTMGHLYWNYMTPEAVPQGTLDPDGLRYLRGAVRAYYRYVDDLIGPFIDAADENTAIVVVSDHGFKGGPGRGVEVHNIDGILVMKGQGVGQGEITGATVYDMTPTLLVLAGLPPAQDMRGKVLWSALDPRIPRDRFENVLATYETGTRGDGTLPDSPVDKEVLERLKSLGYID